MIIFFQVILSGPSWNLIIFYILLECKSKKIKIAILELKNPYEQIFVGHPVDIGENVEKAEFALIEDPYCYLKIMGVFSDADPFVSTFSQSYSLPK